MQARIGRNCAELYGANSEQGTANRRGARLYETGGMLAGSHRPEGRGRRDFGYAQGLVWGVGAEDYVGGGGGFEEH